MQTKRLFEASSQRERVDTEQFVAGVKPLAWIVTALGVTLVGVAAVVYGQNQWAGILYAFIGVVQVLIGGSGSFRLRSRSAPDRAGNVVVQHSWIILSIGIATAAIIPSDFFAVETIWMAIAVVIGAIWVLVGVAGIYLSTRSVGARVTV
jgi:hypothetical protein